MEVAEELLLKIKNLARLKTEKVFRCIFQDPKYLCDEASVRVWISYRKKTGVLCISNNLISPNVSTLITFLHKIVFHYIKDEIRKSKEEWDILFIKGFSVNIKYNDMDERRVGERTIEWWV